MALWLLNPPKARRKKGRTMAARKKRKTSGRRPSAKQLAARRKFVAMARARGKAARKTTRKRRKPVMATRRRKATTKRRRRRTGTMRSVVRRGGAKVGRTSWRASGYRRNPVRRRGRRRRNPLSMGGIGGEIMSLGKQTIAVMAGRYLGRTISGFIPFGGTSVFVNAAKGVAVAILIKKFGRRIVSADMADALAIGALLGPVNDLIVSVAPQAAGFLSGGYAMPSFPGGAIGTYPRLSSYSDGQSTAFDDSNFSSYASQDYQNQ